MTGGMTGLLICVVLFKSFGQTGRIRKYEKVMGEQLYCIVRPLGTYRLKSQITVSRGTPVLKERLSNSSNDYQHL